MMLILVSPSLHGDVLGQDGDAALALEVVGVEDAGVLPPQLSLVAELAGLAQHLIDQRGLAVVDVGDDGDIADVVPLHAFSQTLSAGMEAVAGERAWYYRGQAGDCVGPERDGPVKTVKD